MFGGSFDPAYTLAIHALPNLMRPTMNKRNAALVQRHMEESLGVHPERGFVRFVPTPEDNVALGGKTMTAELEELTANDDEGPPPSRSKSKSNRRISMKVRLCHSQPCCAAARPGGPPLMLRSH